MEHSWRGPSPGFGPDYVPPNRFANNRIQPNAYQHNYLPPPPPPFQNRAQFPFVPMSSNRPSFSRETFHGPPRYLPPRPIPPPVIPQRFSHSQRPSAEQFNYHQRDPSNNSAVPTETDLDVKSSSATAQLVSEWLKRTSKSTDNNCREFIVCVYIYVYIYTLRHSF